MSGGQKVNDVSELATMSEQAKSAQAALFRATHQYWSYANSSGEAGKGQFSLTVGKDAQTISDYLLGYHINVASHPLRGGEHHADRTHLSISENEPGLAELVEKHPADARPWKGFPRHDGANTGGEPVQTGTSWVR